MANELRDLQFGWRLLRRNKGFASVAILALALGIGPNVAIFSIIYATFFAPLPYPHPDQLVVVWTRVKGERIPMRANDYLTFSSQSKSFERMDLTTFDSYYLTGENHEQEGIQGGSSTPGEFTKLLGIRMALGRDLGPRDAISGNDHVAVLTNRFWMDQYHADPEIVGKPIRVNDQQYTVVGVLAPSVEDRIPSAHFEVPAVLTPGSENSQVGFVFARLKPGVTIQQAQSELAVINRHIVRKNLGDVSPDQITVGVDPLRNDWLDKKLSRNLWLLLAAVGFVMLIACANLANLLLARGATRQRELAVRSALGATRRQVFGQMVVESLALAITGGAVGIALGWGLLRLALAVMPDLAYQNAEAIVEMNVPVLLFGLAVALFAGVVAGCAPAWHAMRLNLNEVLQQSSRSTGGAGRMRTQRLLVVSEFALALTLLAGAAMTLRSFYNLTKVDLGVQTGGILTSYMYPSGPQVQTANPEKANANVDLLLSRVSALSGVQAAAVCTNFPLRGHDDFPFTIEGQPAVVSGRSTADLEGVSPGFFSVFHVQLLRGRRFGDSDDLKGAPVAMVSEGFAHRYLSGRNPLDSRLVLDTVTGGPQLGPPVTRQIVGVFRDVRNGEHLSDDIAPKIYLPAAQMPLPYEGIAVRTALDPLSLAQDLRTVVGETMPGVSLVQMQTMQASLETQLKGDRFSMLLFGAFALLALVLSALGIYGVIAFSVTQRQHEMGLRVALGAKQRDMLWLVLKDAMQLCLYGTGFGLLGAVAVGRAFHSALFGIGTVDLGGFAVVAALLTCVALLAAFVPAWRSSRTDPMVALRQG